MSSTSIKSDLARVDALSDEQIDDSDIPALGDEFLTKAVAAWPPVKKQLTVRLDADVLEWLRSTGKGYQTRINHILRIAMEHQAHRAPPERKS